VIFLRGLYHRKIEIKQYQNLIWTSPWSASSHQTLKEESMVLRSLMTSLKIWSTLLQLLFQWVLLNSSNGSEIIKSLTLFSIQRTISMLKLYKEQIQWLSILSSTIISQKKIWTRYGKLQVRMKKLWRKFIRSFKIVLCQCLKNLLKRYF